MLKSFFFFTLLLFWLFCLVDSLRHQRSYGWVLLLLLLPPIGVALYLLNFHVLDRAGWRRLDAMAQDYFEAERLERQLEAHDIPGDRLELARIRFRQEKYLDCLRVLKPLLDEDAENPRGQFMAGASLFELNRPDEAIPHLEFVTSEDPDFDFGEALLTLALAFEKTGREDDAIATYRKVLGKYPRADATVRKAYLLLNRGELDEARRDLEAVVEESHTAPGFGRRAERQWIARAQALLARLPPESESKKSNGQTQ